MPAPFGPAGDDVDGPSQAAVVLHVEGALTYVDPVDLREVHVKCRGIHVVGAGPVDPLAVNENVKVPALKAPEHYVIGNASFADLPDARRLGKGLTHVPCR